MKTKIVPLSYNAMFKAVFGNNKYMLSKMVDVILKYCNMKLDIKDKELIIKNNELSLSNVHDRQLVCDYVIKIDKYTDLNIEINRVRYPGLYERNMTYIFKIYYDHFEAGDKYQEFNKYFLLQVNFNNFSNQNNETVNKFFMLDANDLSNYLSRNLCILNVDIATCYKLVYNENKLKEMSYLERIGAMLYTNYLEDISYILGSDIVSMEEKEKFFEEVKDKSSDKDILRVLKFEDNIDYRFDLVEEDALERGRNQGIEQGIEQNTKDLILSMNENKASLEFISKVTNKTIDEIKKIISTND